MTDNPYLPKKAKIIKVFRETDDTLTFRLDTSIFNKFNGTNRTNRPGQFFNIAVLGIGECPISIASCSDKHVDLCIRNVGNVTNAIHQKKAGDYLLIRGPYGNGYPMEEFYGKDIVMVGGGTGVAPLISAVEYIEKNRTKFGNAKLFFGFRHHDAVLFMRNFKRWNDVFDFGFTLDCPNINNKLIKSIKPTNCKTGAVTTLLDKAYLDKDSIAIICGPPVMIRFVAETLLKKGIDEKNIYISYERLMSCGIGKCGHCEVGGKYVCKHGPVFRYDEAKDMKD
ncbi:MAG: FAD/NAD(P)-binding protein [Candidatus Woesearchaeota archaeon]